MSRISFQLAPNYGNWTLAHDMAIEVPDWSVTHRAYGTTIRPNRGLTNWVHFAIPTVTLVNSQRVGVSAAYAFLSVGPKARLIAALVYDGPTLLQGFQPLALGTPTNKVYRWAIDGSPRIQYGIGISLEFECDDTSNDAWMTLIGAAAEFMVPG